MSILRNIRTRTLITYYVFIIETYNMYLYIRVWIIIAVDKTDGEYWNAISVSVPDIQFRNTHQRMVDVILGNLLNTHTKKKKLVDTVRAITRSDS